MKIQSIEQELIEGTKTILTRVNWFNTRIEILG